LEHYTLWNIISSSGLTIIACVYTAIHPNVPSPYEPWYLVSFHRLVTIVFGLISPELVAIWAMRQWTSSYFFSEQMRCYFANMGGFMVYYKDEPWSTTTPRNLLRQIHAGILDMPRITVEEIDDCSKALEGDLLSKGLVIVQVGWFIITASRYILGLAISQLEIGTFAFAVLFFRVCIFWLVKPLDVR
ncbi:hypothetical protein CONPUDRAFT_19119, partial [Coniophora puteana RWD-64-598 SS2]